MKTKYGIIKGIISKEVYQNNSLKSCKINEYNEIVTEYGKFVPLFEDNEVRKKHTESMTFYDNGNIKSLHLNEQANIKYMGKEYLAELITFYATGKIKRIFPLNGKLSGYWTEENEESLASNMNFDFEFGNVNKKIIGVQFYESGEIKSLTFWPKEIFTLKLPDGELKGRIGLSLYKSGKIKSVEPSKSFVVKTQIGELRAFDSTPNGINGDSNSLNFYEDGRIKSMKTTRNKVKVSDVNGIEKIFEAYSVPSKFNLEMFDFVPLKIDFMKEQICLCDNYYFNIHENNISVL